MNLRNRIKGFNEESVKGLDIFNLNVPTLWKKKGKSLKTTWSDEEFEGSEEEDDHVSNYIAFRVTSKKDVSASVTTDAEHQKQETQIVTQL